MDLRSEMVLERAHDRYLARCAERMFEADDGEALMTAEETALERDMDGALIAQGEMLDWDDSTPPLESWYPSDFSSGGLSGPAVTPSFQRSLRRDVPANRDSDGLGVVVCILLALGFLLILGGAGGEGYYF